MNYGRSRLQRNKDALSNKKSRARNKLFLAGLRLVLASLVILAAAMSVLGAVYVGRLIAECPDAKDIDISPKGYASTVYDNDGNRIETLAASGANREYVYFDNIPEHLVQAFIAIEDSRFYSHNGIDVRGIIRAGLVGILSGGDFSQGASTITQQLLKNNYFINWTSEGKSDRFERKIQEQYLAVQLEEVMSKDEILENYLNTINLGANTLGVESASKRYFNKSVSELTLSESAVIAGITQNPTRYNPITNPRENAIRRQKVLKNMLDMKYLTKSEYDEAMADDVYERIEIANQDSRVSVNSYFVDALTTELSRELVEESGYTETESYQKIYSGGLKIYSTQDTEISNIAQKEINDPDNYPGDPRYSFSLRLTVEKADGTFANYSESTMLSYYRKTDSSYTINYSTAKEALAAVEEYKRTIIKKGDKIAEGGEEVVVTLQPQAAMTIIDQSTGAICAIVGGRGDKKASKTLNRATGITRQPGSTFKILGAYAPAIDAAGMTLASVWDDEPMKYDNGKSLKNYDNRYRGFTNIREGITDSVNVVAVKTLSEIGTGLGYEYATDFGITTLVTGDNNQSLALGGITNGVTNLELCGAYAAIANMGVRNTPYFYTRVEDRDGRLLIDNTKPGSAKVIKPQTAWLLTDAMKDVMKKGTGKRASFKGMTLAGKSGTTTGNRDAVFAGYSPYYTGVFWGGYDDNTPQASATYAKVIWKKVMSEVHDGLENKDFDKPGGIVELKVCKKSGKLAVEGVCDHDPRGSMVYSEYFAEGTAPTTSCDHHITETICNASGKVATESCPEEQCSTKVFMTGGNSRTEDGAYMTDPDDKCDIHK